MKRYLVGFVCCLLTTSVFSEEEKNPKISVEDISIASADDPEDLFLTKIISIDEIFSQGGDITLEASEDSLPKIAYPIEEAIWEKNSGRKQ